MTTGPVPPTDARPAPGSPWRRPTVGAETLALAASLFTTAAYNVSFWQQALAGRNAAAPASWLFAGGTFLLIWMLQFAILAAFVPRRVLQPLLAVLLLVSAAASHYMQRYGVVIDVSMVRNVLHTDTREAAELIGPALVGAVLLLGVVPAALVCWPRVARRPLRRALLVRGASAAAALALAAAMLLLVFQDLGSLMRNHRALRYTITPANIVWSLGRAVAGDARAVAVVRDAPQPAERAALPGRRRTLFVLVVGETARAASFSLNGYARPTNPELSRLEVINFASVTACGTATEVSLPCMFSPFGRADYDEQRIRRHDSLLHVLARAGLQVLWRDNQSGCKGVCAGLPVQDVSRETVEGLCTADRCLDEILLHGLDGIVRDARGDLFVVLHQLGSHGPAYHRRYPPEAREFVPTCDRDELRECSREQIVNSYDNSILYTDRFLARTIGLLAAWRERFDVAMLYVSDHGESLGEHGLYLHGLPYAIAPREQLEVPMVWWLPPEAARGLGVDPDCLRRRALQPASHDNLFHSVLGLLQVRTPEYRPERDLSAGCRARPMP